VLDAGLMGALSWEKTASNSKNSEIGLWNRLKGVETEDKIKFRLDKTQVNQSKRMLIMFRVR
jgi:hypothetical protein